MAAFAIIVFALVAALLLLLSLPVEINFAVQTNAKPWHDASVALLFGMVTVPVKPSVDQDTDAKSIRKRTAKTHEPRRRGLVLIRDRDARMQVIRCLSRLIDKHDLTWHSTPIDGDSAGPSTSP